MLPTGRPGHLVAAKMGGALYAEGSITPIFINVSFVMIYSSETSILPSFACFYLAAMIVCPGCHGHFVPLIRARAFLPL